MDPKLHERLEAILVSLDKQQEKETRVQNRSSSRHSFRAVCKTKYVEIRDGKMQLCNPTQPLLGLSRNLSRGGMSLLSRKWFARGDILESEVQLNNKKRVYFLGVAVFSRFCGDNIYETGMHFYDFRDTPILIGNQYNIEAELSQIHKMFQNQTPKNVNKLMQYV